MVTNWGAIVERLREIELYERPGIPKPGRFGGVADWPAIVLALAKAERMAEREPTKTVGGIAEFLHQGFATPTGKDHFHLFNRRNNLWYEIKELDSEDEPVEVTRDVCPKCGGQWADYAVTKSPVDIGDERWVTKCRKCGTRKAEPNGSVQDTGAIIAGEQDAEVGTVITGPGDEPCEHDDIEDGRLYINHKDYCASCHATPAIVTQVFHMVVDWCESEDCYSGEGLWQTDSAQVTGLALLEEIIEKVLEFKVTYNDDIPKGADSATKS